MSNADQPQRPATPRPTRPAAAPERGAETPANPLATSRPIRPATPIGTIRRDDGAELIVIPQGLSLADPGLSGMPSLRTPVPSRESIAALKSARADALRQTLFPSCLILGLTLPLLAGGWFTLDRFSVARDNPLGIALPISLGVAGGLFFITALLLLLKSRGSAAAASAN